MICSQVSFIRIASRNIHTEFQANSTRIFAAINAFQGYVLEGRSRASYMTRCEAKTGIIWFTRLGNRLKNIKMPNI